MFAKIIDRFKESRIEQRYYSLLSSYKDSFGLNLIMLLFLVIMVVIKFASDLKAVSDTKLIYTGTSLDFSLMILPFLAVGIYYIVHITDAIIEFYSKKVTDGDYVIESYLSKLIFGDNHEGLGDGNSFFIYMICTVGVIWGTWFLVSYPIFIWVVILVGVHHALMKLAAMVYRTSKRLNTHVKDPDAHKKGE